jgi:TRAP-type C4-dicarboxylate transport system substrate-binding protein
MSKKTFDGLNKQQQQALLAAGRKAEEYFAKASKGLDDEMVEIFKLHKVQVVTLTPAEYAAWINLARESSYAEFAKAVPDGKKLIDAALAVQ